MREMGVSHLLIMIVNSLLNGDAIIHILYWEAISSSIIGGHKQLRNWLL